MPGWELLRAVGARHEGNRSFSRTTGTEERAVRILLRSWTLYLSRLLDRPWTLYLSLGLSAGECPFRYPEQEAEEDHQGNDSHRYG